MEELAIRVLLVDDNAADRDLIVAMFGEIPDGRFHITQTATLEDALSALELEPFDVCLVDFRLGPDSGLDVIRQASEHSPGVPFILLTGFGSRDIDLAAMQAGAVGYLNKDELTAASLERVVRYAVEGFRERAAQKRRLFYTALERFSAPENRNGRASARESQSLREIASDAFEQFIEDYGELLDLALENRTYKVAHDVSGGLRNMADRLGAFMARPRDVVEIHHSASRAKTRGLAAEKALPYAEEGSLMALELMGYLTAYYRGFAWVYRREVMQRRRGESLAGRGTENGA